ncbi:unnamed protein product, partial [Owenia fusiformis]
HLRHVCTILEMKMLLYAFLMNQTQNAEKRMENEEVTIPRLLPSKMTYPPGFDPIRMTSVNDVKVSKIVKESFNKTFGNTLKFNSGNEIKRSVRFTPSNVKTELFAEEYGYTPRCVHHRVFGSVG